MSDPVAARKVMNVITCVVFALESTQVGEVYPRQLKADHVT